MTTENHFAIQIFPENQGTKSIPRAFRFSKSTNNRFIGVIDFNLQPFGTSDAFFVSAVGFLRNNAFQTKVIGDLVKIFSVFDNVVVELDYFILNQSFFQQFFSLKIRQFLRRMSIEPKQIENLINQSQIRIIANSLKPLKVRFSFVIVGNDFTIQNHFVFLKFERIRHFFEFLRKIESVSGIQSDRIIS